MKKYFPFALTLLFLVTHPLYANALDVDCFANKYVDNNSLYIGKCHLSSRNVQEINDFLNANPSVTSFFWLI